MNRKLKVLDLFSGIGMFSFGLEQAGMETAAFVERNTFCKAVLKHHWPAIPILDDVCKVEHKKGKLIYVYDECRGHEDLWVAKKSKIDIICGGFPCTNISVAGKKEGIYGKESGLWSEFKRIISEVRPSYAIIENVAALRGNGLVTVLKDLWSVGYDAEWAIISAAQAGAPHLRERIWIVAYPSGHAGREIGSRVLSAESCQKSIHNNIAEYIGRGPRLGIQNIIENYWREYIANAAISGNEKMCEGKELPPECIGREESDSNLENPGESNKQVIPNSHIARLEGGQAKKRRNLRRGISQRKISRNQDYWDKNQPPVLGVDDGCADWLDGHTNKRKILAAWRKYYKERVAAIGNSLVPQIAELIGRRIADYELNKQNKS